MRFKFRGDAERRRRWPDEKKDEQEYELQGEKVETKRKRKETKLKERKGRLAQQVRTNNLEKDYRGREVPLRSNIENSKRVGGN